MAGSVRVTTNSARKNFSSGTEYAPLGEDYDGTGTSPDMNFAGQDADTDRIPAMISPLVNTLRENHVGSSLIRREHCREQHSARAKPGQHAGRFSVG